MPSRAKAENDVSCYTNLNLRHGCVNDKRRGRDSNPRWSKPHTGFRDRPIRPLWHLSWTGRPGVADAAGNGILAALLPANKDLPGELLCDLASVPWIRIEEK